MLSFLYQTTRVHIFTENVMLLCGHLTFYEQMTVWIVFNGAQMNVAYNSFEVYMNVNGAAAIESKCICLICKMCMSKFRKIFVQIIKCICTNCKMCLYKL